MDVVNADFVATPWREEVEWSRESESRNINSASLTAMPKHGDCRISQVIAGEG